MAGTKYCVVVTTCQIWMSQLKLNPDVGVRSWLAGTPRSLLNVELSERSPDLREFLEGAARRWISLAK